VEAAGIEPASSFPEPKSSQGLASTPENTLAYSLACQVEKDPNLKLLVALWHRLPEPVRAGIIAMVKASATPDKV
jgi:hypothetical protein